MKIRLPLIALAVFVSAIFVSGALRGQTDASSAAASYKVDPVHSSVVFRITHGGVAPFYGRFDHIQGSFDWNPDNPDQIAFDVAIQVDSIHTGNEKRDGHLESGEFFNAAEFPAISFKSGKVSRTGENSFSVAGDLTLLGVSKPVTARVDFIGAGKFMGASRAGFDVGFTIKRSEFGMDYGVANGMLGDEVKLMIGIEGVQQ